MTTLRIGALGFVCSLAAACTSPRLQDRPDAANADDEDGGLSEAERSEMRDDDGDTVVFERTPGPDDASTPSSPDSAIPAPVSDSCTAREKKCEDLTPWQCSESRQWMAGIACPFVCDHGECTGVCTPGARQCADDGRTPQTCDARGTWVSDARCPNLCRAGTCSGSCEPNATNCALRTPQTCDADGAWQSGAECPYLCRAGACVGSCFPQESGCVAGTTTPQTCDADGVWQPGAVQAYLCGAECTPGTSGCYPATRQTATCDAQGHWVAGPIVANQCGAHCTPGAESCDDATHAQRTCNDQGTWGSRVVAGRCGAECTPGQTACGAVEAPSFLRSCLSEGCFYAWTLPNNVFRATCDNLGQWTGQSFCPGTCTVIHNGEPVAAHFCQISGGVANCFMGGNCPSTP